MPDRHDPDTWALAGTATGDRGRRATASRCRSDEPFYTLDLRGAADRRPLPESAGRDNDLQRNRVLGDQTIVEPVDAPGERRLAATGAATSRRKRVLDPNNRWNLGGPERRRRHRRRLSARTTIWINARLAVQRHRAVPAPARHQFRRQLLRPRGIPAAYYVWHPPDKPTRLGTPRSTSRSATRRFPPAQRVRARSAAREDLPDRRA